MSYAPKDEKVF